MRRVAITGLGMVNALGLDAETSFARMLNGENGVTPITKFDTSQHAVHFAASVEWDVAQHFSAPEQRKLEQPKAASPGTKMLTDGSNHDVQTSVEEAVTAREEAVTARVVKPMPDTFDFNDLFGGKQPPADRQNV